MTAILDRFNNTKAEFVPATVQDLFALRLAQKLGDSSAAAHYSMLVTEHSDDRLLLAYRRAVRNVQNGDLGRRFHAELEKTPSNVNNGCGPNLISVRVERRAVAAAVFRGDHLEYADSRQLSSSHDKALVSAVGFINWMLARFPVESAALEAIPSGYEYQRRVLHDAICQTLRDSALPIWEIPKPVLLGACGYPALKSRQRLRSVATSIWPVLKGTHGKVFAQDAAILGLHAQVERHFILN
jgi:hypothetical protein